MQVAGNGRHAPRYRTIYARTRIAAPETAEYLLKAQSDDEMLLWLDGRLIATIRGQNPVTRTAVCTRIKIEKGEHEFADAREPVLGAVAGHAEAAYS